MANVKIPYALTPAVAVDQRRLHMASAIARGLPRLTRHPPRPTETAYLACYGPSLQQTWEHLRGKSPIIAMSGATKWLDARGITADYVLEMDPRPSQMTVSLPPVPGAHYLVASCVVPQYFDALEAAGNPVTLWHTVNTNWDDETRWVSLNDPAAKGPEGPMVVHGGCTVGLTAIHVAGLLGYTRFEIHGMDGSFSDDGQRHAGQHGGKTQPNNINWAAGGRTFRTSKIMANAVAESVNLAKNFPIITVWHGDGLTQALIRKANLPNAACADQAEKVAKLGMLTPRILQAPSLPKTGSQTFWDGLVQFLQPQDLPDLLQHIPIAEARRRAAKYNTGTIPFEAAVYLRALSRFYAPSVIAEVGTFIGTSTHALAPTRVLYTCDQSNDCVPTVMGEPSIVTHPYQSSARMFREIQEPVDLFFIDGRLTADDLTELRRLSHPGSVYVLDDHVGREKGVANAQALRPLLPTHALMPPAAHGRSTLAAFVPFLQRGAS
jgi:hypothetical protein